MLKRESVCERVQRSSRVEVGHSFLPDWTPITLIGSRRGLRKGHTTSVHLARDEWHIIRAASDIIMGSVAFTSSDRRDEEVTYRDQIRRGDQSEVGSNGNVLYSVQDVDKLFTVNPLHGGGFVMTSGVLGVAM